MVVAGLGCLAGLAAFIAWWSMRRVVDGARTARLIEAVAALGLTAVCTLGAALVLGGPLAAFVLVPGSMAVGIAAALRSPHEGGGPSNDSDDDEPPWWPSFERELKRYRERNDSRV
jgi:hypothetical protein